MSVVRTVFTLARQALGGPSYVTMWWQKTLTSTFYPTSPLVWASDSKVGHDITKSIFVFQSNFTWFSIPKQEFLRKLVIFSTRQLIRNQEEWVLSVWGGTFRNIKTWVLRFCLQERFVLSKVGLIKHFLSTQINITQAYTHSHIYWEMEWISKIGFRIIYGCF